MYNIAKEIDKIIQSKTAPKSNNVLWDDGESLKINRNGKWEETNTTEIKDGSVPLNALDDNIKELLNSSLGFKQFMGYLSKDAPLEVPAFTGGDHYYVEVKDNVIKLDTNIETLIPFDPPFLIKYNSRYPKAELSIVTEDPITFKFPIFRGINANEAFIPDTIARTKDVRALEARIAAIEAQLNS